jgi:hypothetical protein
MTPDDQPAAPAGLRPETAVICAGRPSRAASEPLNIPIVLASNFHASTTAAPGTEEGIRPTHAPTPRPPGRHSRQPWARWRAVTPWLSPPAWPRSLPCSASCQPVAASLPLRTAISGSASF